MLAEGCTRREPNGCIRACCVVQRKPDSDEEDEPPPAKQQRTTTAAPAAASSSALAIAPPPTGDTSRSEVLLGDRIMVGQTVELKFQANDHLGRAGTNGTLGRTVAYEAASKEKPYGRFVVNLERHANGAVLEAGKSCKMKPENLLPVAPRPIPKRPAQLKTPAIDFPGSRASSSGEAETTFALAIEWLEEQDDLRGY